MDKFKSSVSGGYTFVKDKWTSIARKTQIIILAVAGVVIVSAIILTALLNRSDVVSLVLAADRDEVIQIESALADAEIEIERVSSNNEIFVKENVRMRARRAISEAGLPKPRVNNNVWDEGVDMFSTDATMREKQRQQLQEWIVAYLNDIDKVDRSQVILTIPKTQNFVMIENREESRASVKVHLKMGEVLTG
ncbi:MAG: hypothetical protein FWG45_04570, partial [Oscillospiraceae bacterium]|nr:hypothetical protein [Oscillospiraceae bacterium]